jgi:hypothetical protein
VAKNSSQVGPSAWREIVRARVAGLRYEADRRTVTSDPESRQRQAIDEYVTRALEAVEHKYPYGVWQRVRAWWTGADIERAWRNIHAAEVVLYEHMPSEDLRPRLAGIYAYARSYLGEQDLRVVQLHALLGRELGRVIAESSVFPPATVEAAPIQAEGSEPPRDEAEHLWMEAPDTEDPGYLESPDS